MTDQVQEVKSKVDIATIIGERVELKKAGRNLKGLCPFHSEKSPSFMVSPELQMFKCFGCAESGDVFSFLEKYEGMEFPEALTYLADRVGVKLQSFSGGHKGEKERLLEINSWTNRFYQYVLLSHIAGKKALGYLLGERGLSLEMIKLFGLGFSPDNPFALKKFLVDKKGLDPRDIEKAGIGYFKDGTLFDRLRGRVVFPLADHRGGIVGFAGRILPGGSSDMAKYINTPETPIYHKGSLLYGLHLTKKEIKKSGVAIVVEGELDTISSYQAGVTNVVALKGSALTEDQVRLISRFCQKVILCLDADIAGDSAAKRGIAIAQELGLEVKIARLGEFKDPDEAARKSPKMYKKALIKSVNIWDFLISSVFERVDVSSGSGVSEASREIVPVLSSITDKIVQAHYVQLSAKKLGIESEAVYRALTEWENKEGPQIKKDEAIQDESAQKDRRQLLEERLLSLILALKPQLLGSTWAGELISSPLVSKIRAEFVKFSKDQKKFSLPLFAQSLPKELFNGFSEAVLKETGFGVEEEELKKELGIVRSSLQILAIKDEKVKTQLEIAEAEKTADEKRVTVLGKKLAELNKKESELDSLETQGIILEGN